MADDKSSEEIQVVEPGFFDEYHDEIAQQDGAVVAQQQMIARLAQLQGKAQTHDRALAQLLIRGSRVSADTYLAVGEPGLVVGGYKNIYLPDVVLMAGEWKVDSIFAAADKSSSVDLQVTIHNFPQGIDWNILAPKAANFPIDYAFNVDRVIRPSEYNEVQIALANGAAGDKCVVTFNMERVK